MRKKNMNEGVLDTVKKLFNKNSVSKEKIIDVVEQITEKLKVLQKLNARLSKFENTENNIWKIILYYPVYRMLYRYINAKNKKAFCNSISDIVTKYIIAILVKKKISDESHKNQGLISIIRELFNSYNEEIIPLLDSDVAQLKNDGFDKNIQYYIAELENLLKVLPEKDVNESTIKRTKNKINNRLTCFFENIRDSESTSLDAISKDYTIIKSSIILKLESLEENSKEIYNAIEKKLSRFDNENTDETYLSRFAEELLTKEQYYTLFLNSLASDIDVEKFQEIVLSDPNNMFNRAKTHIIGSTSSDIRTSDISDMIVKFNKNMEQLNEIMHLYDADKKLFLKNFSSAEEMNDLISLSNSFNKIVSNLKSFGNNQKIYLERLNSFLTEEKKEKIDVDEIMKGFDDIEKKDKPKEESDFEFDRAFASMKKQKSQTKTTKKKQTVDDDVEEMFSQIRKEKRNRN